MIKAVAKAAAAKVAAAKVGAAATANVKGTAGMKRPAAAMLPADAPKMMDGTEAKLPAAVHWGGDVIQQE